MCDDQQHEIERLKEENSQFRSILGKLLSDPLRIECHAVGTYSHKLHRNESAWKEAKRIMHNKS